MLSRGQGGTCRADAVLVAGGSRNSPRKLWAATLCSQILRSKIQCQKLAGAKVSARLVCCRGCFSQWSAPQLQPCRAYKNLERNRQGGTCRADTVLAAGGSRNSPRKLWAATLCSQILRSKIQCQKLAGAKVSARLVCCRGCFSQWSAPQLQPCRAYKNLERNRQGGTCRADTVLAAGGSRNSPRKLWAATL